LRRSLGLCGIEVIAVPGAGDSLETVTHATEAALNVVVYPEYGLQPALYSDKSMM
jgi:nitrogenase molybdenum-iron protein alpha/beta subunit